MIDCVVIVENGTHDIERQVYFLLLKLVFHFSKSTESEKQKSRLHHTHEPAGRHFTVAKVRSHRNSTETVATHIYLIGGPSWCAAAAAAMAAAVVTHTFMVMKT